MPGRRAACRRRGLLSPATLVHATGAGQGLPGDLLVGDPRRGQPVACFGHFAGALGVRLGGALSYGGRIERRPVLNGAGRDVGVADIERAGRLSRRAGWAALAVPAGARAAWSWAAGDGAPGRRTGDGARGGGPATRGGRVHGAPAAVAS